METGCKSWEEMMLNLEVDSHKSESIFRNFSVCIVILIILDGLLLVTVPTPQVSAASIWSSDSDKDFLGSGSIFNNTILNGTGVDTKMQLIIVSDWWDKFEMFSPTPRQDPAIAITGDVVVLFGGFGNGPYSNDTWIYNIRNTKWTQVFPRESPSPRFGSAMAGIWNENKVLLFGGGTSSTFYSDTWIFSLEDNQWSLLNLTEHPSNRSYALMTSFNGTTNILLYGGYENQFGRYCDTWILDTSTFQWRQSLATIAPSARWGAAMAPVMTEDKAVMFGGCSPLPQNDTWVYHLSEDKWYPMIINNSPPPRTIHSMAPIGNYGEIALFGGSNQDFGYNDTWIYNISTNRWTEIYPAHSPTRGIQYFMVNIQNRTDVMLICSSNNITWTFHQFAYSKTGDYSSPYYDIGNPSEFLSICWSASIPSGTFLDFQVRTADNLTTLKSKPFVGYDNSTTTYYNISGSLMDVTHYHDAMVQYKVFFKTSNPDLTASLETVYIAYDVIPGPPIPLYPLNGTWANELIPVFRWLPNDTDSAAMNAFEWQMHRWSSESGWLEYTSGEIISNASSYIPKNLIEDGICYWRVRTQDIEGNWGPFSEYQKFGVDTVPPKPITAQIIPNRWTNGQCRIFFSTEDDLSGMNNYTIFIDGKSIGTQISPYTFPDIPDGAHQIIIRAYDKAGNYAESTVRALIDRRKPEPFLPVINPPTWTNSSPQLIFETNDTSSGISHYEIELDSQGFFIGHSPFTFLDLTDGIHTIIVRAFDRAGNYQDGSIDAYIDKTPPGDFIISTSPSGWTSENPMITFNAIDNTSDIDHFELKVNNGSFTCRTSPYILNDLLEGSNTITVRAYDKAGNLADMQIPANIDRNAPDAFVPVTAQGNWTRIAPTIFFSTNDSISGVDRYEMQIDDGPFMKRTSPFTLPLLLDDPHNILVRAFDKAGNFIDGNITVFFDTTPPTGLSIKINKGAKATSSDIVTLTVSATDITSGLDQMCFSNDGIEYSPWEPFVVTKSWRLASGYGERTVYIKIKDHAGNEATPESAGIMKEVPNQWLLPVSILILMVSSIIIGYGAFRYIKSRN